MSSPKIKKVKKCAALDKQHSDAEKVSEGDGESKTTRPSIALVKKS